MANLNTLIISADKYKVFLTLNSGTPFLLRTLEEISQDITMTDETIYGIGSVEPIGEKRNKKQIKGTLRIQAGELNAVLAAAGLTDSSQIENAVLCIASITEVPFIRTYTGVNINSEKVSIKAGDNQTIVDVDFKAVSVI